MEIPSWAIGVAIIILASSLGRGLRPWRRSHPARAAELPEGDAAQLRETIDEMQKRLGELEERLDFAERLLAKQRETERLGGAS